MEEEIWKDIEDFEGLYLIVGLRRPGSVKSMLVKWLDTGN